MLPEGYGFRPCHRRDDDFEFLSIGLPKSPTQAGFPRGTGSDVEVVMMTPPRRTRYPGRSTRYSTIGFARQTMGSGSAAPPPKRLHPCGSADGSDLLAAHGLTSGIGVDPVLWSPCQRPPDLLARRDESLSCPPARGRRMSGPGRVAILVDGQWKAAARASEEVSLVQVAA